MLPPDSDIDRAVVPTTVKTFSVAKILLDLTHLVARSALCLDFVSQPKLRRGYRDLQFHKMKCTTDALACQLPAEVLCPRKDTASGQNANRLLPHGQSVKDKDRGADEAG